MKFLVLFDTWKKEAEALAHEIVKWCAARGIETELQPELETRSRDRDTQTIALALGGDGFIMRKAKALQKARIPILGINFGRVGFLTVAEPEEWEATLKRVLAGNWALEERIMLNCTHFNEHGDLLHTFKVANDVYIRHPRRMVSLKVFINGLSAYEDLHADGIIICTPMGSTAYYLAAGGRPFPSGIGIKDICALAMNTSALIQPETDIITVALKDIGSFDKEPAFLFADGEEVLMHKGDKILVARSKQYVYFAVPQGFSWLHVAQKKLGLSR